MERMIADEESSFVGRSRELALIGEALRAGRLVTLTGPGGAGKTRLARRAGALGTVAAEDGVAWADLSPLRDPGLLAATVADALGLSDHTPRPPAEAVCAWVGSRRMLLVLDSCEHLTAECRDLVGDLLTACPHLRVLATSREPLRVATEAVVRIGPLASSHEALALFADRAAAAGSPLRDAGERRLATMVCDRLDRLPLALELAAALLRSMPLAELHARPRAAVDLPPKPRRTAPPRHAEPPRHTEPPRQAAPPRHGGLRTTIGWSHELCTPQERLLWARLSFLPGPFDGTTAWQVACGSPLSPDGVRRTLAALCDKSIVMEQRGTYRMLDTVREYGRMWLSELGEEHTIAIRHAEHVFAEIRRAHQEWLGPAQRTWYRRVAVLHADIRLATEHFLRTDPRAALELIGHYTFFWVCSGFLYEARQYLERAIELLPEEERRNEAWVRGLWSLGLTQTLQGDYDAARATAVACTRAARAARDTEELGRAAYLEGVLHLLEGRPLAASAVADAALSGRAAGYPDGPTAATVLCRLVRVFALTGSGRLDEARHEALRLRAVCVEVEEYWTRSYVDHQLALIAVLEGRAADAVRHARAVLDAKRHIGDAFGVAMALDVLAIALSETGDARAAAHAFGAALRFWERVGHPQRGTPEMASLRDDCEERLVHTLGREAYTRALRQTTRYDARTLMTWASQGGPLPEH
ncbi:ATP-binding protein [Streptomyces heilongjiangensis]|uniref:ATP-binding protein n=1 Tax=Streptomyces heilongjiangensis TaxID=945052 RepID=A0ABW1BB02_9ACTN|nr:regulator [Streptomyces heilongjiangensis]MDC2946293.1 regulator [Streptomyces heilongjiangensis]